MTRVIIGTCQKCDRTITEWMVTKGGASVHVHEQAHKVHFTPMIRPTRVTHFTCTYCLKKERAGT